MSIRYYPDSSLDEVLARLSGVETGLSDLPAPLQLADVDPPAIALDSVRGESPRAAHADHTHTARVQRKIVTLNANGEATWLFARSFASKPVLTPLYFEMADNAPVIVKGKSWVMEGQTYTGVVVKAYRSRSLPVMNPVSGVLSGVTNGVNSAINALTGFNVFGGGNLLGIEVHLSAGEQL